MFEAWDTTSGFGDVSLTPTQQQIAARIVAVGQQRGASAKQIQAALSAGWVESRFRNLSYGDRDSLGVFQQRPSQGWGSAADIQTLDYAINAFYDGADKVNDSSMDFGQLAQAVQRSGFPARYGQAGSIVDQILGAIGITLPASSGGDSGASEVITTTEGIDLFSGGGVALPVIAIALVAWLLLR